MADDKNTLFKPSESMRDLQFLEELEKTPNLSQRELSNKFGIALGVTNACLKRMARRGWIRLRKVPPRRIGYYLTPKGFAEKAKLTMTFLSYNIHHYSRLKAMIGEKFLEMASQGVERVVFYGVSDEMEVAYVTLQGVNLDLVVKLFGYQVQRPELIPSMRPDGVLITSLTGNERILKELKELIERKRIRVERL